MLLKRDATDRNIGGRFDNELVCKRNKSEKAMIRNCYNQVLLPSQDTKTGTERTRVRETISKALCKLHVDDHQASRNVTKTLCRRQTGKQERQVINQK